MAHTPQSDHTGVRSVVIFDAFKQVMIFLRKYLVGDRRRRERVFLTHAHFLPYPVDPTFWVDVDPRWVFITEAGEGSDGDAGGSTKRER